MTKLAHNRREKLFGAGRPRPLDRNSKARLMALARMLKRRTERGRHYGAITAKALDVLEALLWSFHNARTGLCFPSLERIAEMAGCARSTVAKAIKALEAAGLMTWVNRLVRRREYSSAGWRWRVLRTSNGYQFIDPLAGQPSKSDFPARTKVQDSSFNEKRPETGLFGPLEQALARLKTNVDRQKGAIDQVAAIT